MHFSWLGMRDSNPRYRDQNPVPYHLANPQQCQERYIRIINYRDSSHVPRPRNFTVANQLASEGFLANCHGQFSPRSWDVGPGALPLGQSPLDPEDYSVTGDILLGACVEIY